MMPTASRKYRQVMLCLLACTLVFSIGAPVYAQQSPPPENPQSGSMGIEGTLPADPPEQGATIAVPTNGQTFSDIPIQVSGLCPDELLVQIFSNEIFVGATMCENGSYELQIDLFGAQNDLVARVSDMFDQFGPDSNVVTVTLDDAAFGPIAGPPVTVTSDFARRGADPGSPLTWPFIVSGGTAPYAVSVDPGDGSSSILQTVETPGVFDVEHTYAEAGIYRITVRVTDANDMTAFLQVVGVARGEPASADQIEDAQAHVHVIWWPAVLSVLFIIIAFWLGRRYQVQALRKELERHHR